MATELTPEAIRGAAFDRKVRGYDADQVEKLLADVADQWTELLARDGALSKQVETLQRQREERESWARDELEQLNARLADRERQAAELEEELNRLRSDRAGEAEQARSLGEELSSLRTAQEEHETALADQHEAVARLTAREKALVEQIAMLEAQAGQTAEAEIALPAAAAPAVRPDRHALRSLARLDRAVEAIELQARRDAEKMLRKARKRADEIVRSAEAERLQDELVRLSALGERLRDVYAAAAGTLHRLESIPHEAPTPAPRRDLLLDHARPASELHDDLRPVEAPGVAVPDTSDTGL